MAFRLIPSVARGKCVSVFCAGESVLSRSNSAMTMSRKLASFARRPEKNMHKSGVALNFGSPAQSWIASQKYASTQVDSSLVDFLKEEIEAETELARKSLGDRDAPSVPGFHLTTEDAEVTLHKQHGPEKVTVKFNVNHSVDSGDATVEGMEDEAPPSQQTEQSEAPQEMLSRPPFTVEVEKGQQKLVFDCQIVTESAEKPDTTFEAFEIDEIYIYSGEMNEKVYATSSSVIDGQLYDHLMNYLSEKGIDDRFVAQLTQFATHYEHAQYVALLRKIRDFVQA